MKCIKQKSLMEKLYDQSDDLVEMLNQQCKERPEDSTECRYKIIVATLLPLIFDRLRACFFLLNVLIGVMLALAFKLG